jgi:hypothetical protein
MDGKLKMLLAFLPKAILEALTPEAVAAIPKGDREGDSVIIRNLPFRVGRESRVVETGGKPELGERREKGNSELNNDLYLLDSGHQLNISRNHFQIVKNKDGYTLVDRGSVCGTKIGGQDIGSSSPLRDGDVIGIGAVGSPYIYRFISFDEYELRLNPRAKRGIRSFSE